MGKNNIKETTLFKKIYGSNAAGHIGASMGEPARRYGGATFDPYRGFLGILEGAHYKALEERFGRINTFLPRTNREVITRWHNSPKFHFVACEYPPGITEDGSERKYLVMKAIWDKKGRITAEDLAASWLKYVKPDKFGYHLLPRDKATYENMKRFPAREVGKYDRWPGNVDCLMMIHPVGWLNAGNPKQAALDALDVCTCIQSPLISYAPYAAAAIAAAIAEAFKPEATIDSIIEASLRYVDQNVQEIIQEGIEIAKAHPDIYEVREPFYQKFGGRVPTDSLEVISESMALFYIAKGDPMTAIIGGCNFGRDADCLASIAGAIAGAYKGIDSIPMNLVEAMDKAMAKWPHTIIDLTIEEQTAKMCEAVLNNLNELKIQIQIVESLMRYPFK